MAHPSAPPADVDPTTLRWKKGLCGVCPAGCWVELGMDGEGRIAGIRPDEGHPLGMTCRRGDHAPDIVYSEHRLRTPLRRTGPKGSYEFEPVSWEEAYGLIAENFRRIKEEDGPEATAIYTGRGAFELSLNDLFCPAESPVSSASNVLFPFGSPNTMGVGALCYVSMAMIAPHVTLGRMYLDMFADIENGELLVVWGANPATDSPPLEMHRIEAAVERGARVVVIDPRYSETAERTDARWVPIRPGTDGALALSMIQVLLEEERHDAEFAEEWCHGFEELARYVQHFRPEQVEPVTGVPAATIRELARAIASAGGAAPIMYTGLEYSDSGVQAIRAVQTLWALAGQLDVAGGLCLAMPGNHFPLNKPTRQANPDLDLAVARDTFPLYSHYRGEGHALGLVKSVLDDDPYRIRGLIIHGASLLTSWPQTPVWRETLAELDFLVTIDRQLTADSAYADIVLPATTMFETESYMTYGSIFRIRERAIEPLGEARPDTMIMTGLAEALGYGDLYPSSEEEVLRTVLEGTGWTPEQVREAGGWVQLDTPMMEYRKWKKGLLREDGANGFQTPTGKFEIHSTILEDYGYDPLPRYTEPAEGPLAAPELAREYPLVFNSGARTQVSFRSQHHGVPGLVHDNPEPVVELNPADAEPRGIATGDLVTVKSPRGQVPFRARVTDAIAAGSVEANMGAGAPVGPEPWQRWNANELTDIERYDEISGFPIYKALLCQVEKAEAGSEASRETVLRNARHLPADGNGGPGSQPVTAGLTAFDSSRPRVDLDNNATSGVADAVREAMLPFLAERHGNPSSIHTSGRRAAEALERARRQVAKLIHARPRSIHFTGGGSEADNLALKGAVWAAGGRRHVITSTIEHPAVLQTCRFLERTGCEVTWLGVDREGFVRPEELEAALRDDTVIVSVMLANNEVGTIQPVRELARIARERGALFHTDAVQAAGKIPVDVEELGVDLLTLSGHKFHGPKGVGALFVRKGVELEPLVHGGGQERGLRAGTENMPGIAGMGAAAELALAAVRRAGNIAALRDRLERGVRELVPGAELNGPPDDRLPNTLSLTLPELRGESLVVALDRQGISLSSGSACKAGSPEPTHVLLAMGRSEEQAHCSVRFSLDETTTGEEVDRTVEALGTVLEQMRSTVRFLACK